MYDVAQSGMNTNSSGIFDGLLSILTNGRSVGVDNERLRNAQEIAEQKYQQASRNSRIKKQGGSNQLSDSTGSGGLASGTLDRYLDIVSGFGGNPSTSIAQRDNRSLDSLRQINSDVANYGERALQLRSDIADKAARRDQSFNQSNMRLASDISEEAARRDQTFNQSNMRLAADVVDRQSRTDSRLRQDEASQKGAIDLDSQNQSFFNNLRLGKQQVRDNENQRIYDLEMARLNALGNVYSGSMPQNMLF